MQDQHRSTDDFATIIERLRTEQRTKVDAVVNTARDVELSVVEREDGTGDIALFFDTPDLTELHGGGHVLTPWAHGQVAQRTGIPKRYYDRMRAEQPSLLVDNVHTWWRSEPEHRLLRTIRYANRQPDGSVAVGPPTVRGFLSNSFRTLDNLAMVETVLTEAKEHGARIVSSHLDTERVYLKLVTERLTGEISEGDTIQAGAIIRNSEVGDGRVVVQPFALRLVCTNGMVVPTRYARTHLGSKLDHGILSQEAIAADNASIWLQVRDWVRHAFSRRNVDEVLMAFRMAQGTPVEAPARLAVANVARDNGLTPHEANAVLEHYLRQDDDSQFGITNALTATAHTAGLGYRRQVELEEAGGRLLNAPPKRFTRMVRARRSEEDISKVFATK